MRSEIHEFTMNRSCGFCIFKTQVSIHHCVLQERVRVKANYEQLLAHVEAEQTQREHEERLITTSWHKMALDLAHQRHGGGQSGVQENTALDAQRRALGGTSACASVVGTNRAANHLSNR